ncbi:MAG: tetratricopeptide repeat protein [Desulfatitalea sp.]|nr:tetratricopeptide repeat protein [Desulfatitalea sp.]
MLHEKDGRKAVAVLNPKLYFNQGCGIAGLLHNNADGVKMLMKNAFITATYFSLMLFLSACGESLEKRIGHLEQRAKKHYASGNYAEALVAWEQRRALGRSSAELLEKIGDAYLHLADYNTALDTYTEALSAKPENTQLQIQIGKIHLLQWDLEKADVITKRLAKTAADDHRFLEFEGDFLVLKSDFKNALIRYSDALAAGADTGFIAIKLALCEYALGNEQKANDIYSTLAASAPTDAYIIEQMGNYWKIADNFEKAETMYLRACETEPKDMHLKYTLVDFYSETEHFDKVIHYLEPWMLKARVPISCKMILIEAYLIEGHMDNARALIDNLSRERPNDIEIHLLKSKFYLLDRNPLYAVSPLEFVIQQEPKMALAHYMLGVAYLAAGYNKLGHQSLMEALSLDREYTDAELALADYYYKQKDYTSALEHVKRVESGFSHSYRVQIIKGNILLSQQKAEQAMKCFQYARLLKPDETAPKYFLAIASEQVMGFEEAERLYRSILDSDPDFIDVPLKYAEMLVRHGKAKFAKSYFSQRLKEKPDNTGVTEYILGKVCLAMDDVPAARSFFEMAAIKNQKNYAAHIDLARTFRSEKDVHKKIKILTNAIRQNDPTLVLFLELSAAYVSAGENTKAIKLLSKAIDYFPDDPYIQNNLSALYLENNENLIKAFDLAQSAYQRLSDSPHVNDTLGWAYYKKGFIEQAEWYLREATQQGRKETSEGKTQVAPSEITAFSADTSSAYYHLGVLLYEKRECSEAAQFFRIALSNGLSPKDFAHASQLMENISGD